MLVSEVVVVGSINQDVVLQVKGFVRPGETVAGEDLRYAPGGKGANQAVAATRLADAARPVSFVCQLGSDSQGSMLEAALVAKNLPMMRSAEPSGGCADG